MTVIKDGTGTGFLTGVTDKNRLKTEAIITPDGSDVADQGFGFAVDGTTSITQTEKTVIIIANTGTFTYEIGKIIVSNQNTQPPVSTILSSTITTVKMYVGDAISTSGTVKTATNTNTGSLNAANVTVRTDNPTIQSGTDAEVKQIYFLTEDAYSIDFEGSIILQPSGSFRITCTGGPGVTSGLLCATSIQFFQEIE